MAGIYETPWVYELACSYRAVDQEVDALLAWSARHRSAPVESVLELAAGPAEHARELARRGLTVSALDLSEAMCEFARERAAEQGVALIVVRADMIGFRLDRRFDLIITMLDSICHVFTLDDLIAHLRSVAAHLSPGGLYIVEMTHPADFLTPDRTTSGTWDVANDDVSVHVRWGGPQDPVDPVAQVRSDRVQITVSGPDGRTEISDVVPARIWTATEFEAACRLAGGLDVVAQYGDFDDDTSLRSPEAWRLINVVRAVM